MINLFSCWLSDTIQSSCPCWTFFSKNFLLPAPNPLKTKLWPAWSRARWAFVNFISFFISIKFVKIKGHRVSVGACIFHSDECSWRFKSKKRATNSPRVKSSCKLLNYVGVRWEQFLIKPQSIVGVWKASRRLNFDWQLKLAKNRLQRTLRIKSLYAFDTGLWRHSIRVNYI